MSEPAARSSDDGTWRGQVYQELRDLAGALMSAERAGHTLEPTELVHETWLRLQSSRNAASLPRAEFLGLAAQSMRRILIEHARRRDSQRRGGEWRRTTLSGKTLSRDAEEFLVDLDAVLGELDAHDAELARLVELRFFAGASVEEIAAALGHSERTVKRRWRFARAWLHQRITESKS